ncbi:MAG: PRC-barrel domain-containing protein [Proteobacteria bacterium]|nr:PRC-barrel domain-containing protein [Pseudomonadota bacterium]
MAIRSVPLSSAIAIAGTLAMLAGPAIAQTSPPARTSPGAAEPPAAVVVRPATNPLTLEDVSKIKGTSVYGSDDKKIGGVSTMLMEPSSKKIDRLVVSEGGILGMGSRLVALPLDQFSWDTDKGVFKITKTAEQLKAMPEWREQLSEATDTRRKAPPAGAAAPTGGQNPAAPSQ